MQATPRHSSSFGRDFKGVPRGSVAADASIDGNDRYRSAVPRFPGRLAALAAWRTRPRAQRVGAATSAGGTSAFLDQPRCRSIQRHFETARNGRVTGPAMGTPSAICKVIERGASPFGLQTQLRPSWMVHSPNFPEGSFEPTVQKMTSLCGG